MLQDELASSGPFQRERESEGPTTQAHQQAANVMPNVLLLSMAMGALTGSCGAHAHRREERVLGCAGDSVTNRKSCLRRAA